MGTVWTLDPHQEDHPIAQPAEALQPLFALGQGPIFLGTHESVKDWLARGEVDAMVGEIGMVLAESRVIMI